MAFPEHGLALVQDGWQNLNTGLGDPTRDKRKSSTLDNVRLTYGDCANLYRGDKMAAKVIDIPAAEMVREWFDVLVEGDPDRGELVETRLKELGAKSAFKQAITWARQFGGAGILLGANDGAKKATEPLNVAKVKSVDWLTVVDSSELLPAAWYRDVGAPKYGQPEIYRLMPRFVNVPQLGSFGLVEREKKGIFEPFGGISYVHESRVLPFYGVKLSRMEMLENLGWGDTVYNRIFSVVQDFATAFDSVAHTLSDFAQGVLKMTGLAAAIAAKGSSTITQRLMGINLSRSVARIMLVDADKEDFKREALSFGSIPETLDRFCNLFASVADMPVSLLMGQAPAGLNATGDSDIRWFYDHISHKQEEELVPQAESLVRMLLVAQGGGEPKNWSIKCRSLWQLDEVQEADRRLKVAQADQIYANMPGGATGEEIVTTRFGGDEYNAGKIQLVETDPKKRALAADEQAEKEAALNPPNPPPADQGEQAPANADPAKPGPKAP